MLYPDDDVCVDALGDWWVVRFWLPYEGWGTIVSEHETEAEALQAADYYREVRRGAHQPQPRSGG
jgi:hypothetical protein